MNRIDADPRLGKVCTTFRPDGSISWGTVDRITKFGKIVIAHMVHRKYGKRWVRIFSTHESSKVTIYENKDLFT